MKIHKILFSGIPFNFTLFVISPKLQRKIVNKPTMYVIRGTLTATVIRGSANCHYDQG